MSLHPILRRKVDELFLHWFTEPTTQLVLRDNLTQLQAGDSLNTLLAVATPRLTCSSLGGGVGVAGHHGHGGHHTTSSSLMSPRPQTPPHFPQAPGKIVSPRSPRKQPSSASTNAIMLAGGGGQQHIIDTSNGSGPPSPRGSKVHGKIIKKDETDADELLPNGSAGHHGSTEPGTKPEHNNASSHQDKRRLGTTSNVPGGNSESMHLATVTAGSAATTVPKFYFPQGRPSREGGQQLDSELQRVTRAFDAASDQGAAGLEWAKFAEMTKACGIPLYWKHALYFAAGGHDESLVTKDVFLAMWKKVLQTCHDNATKFIWLLTKGRRSHLIPSDFYPIIQDILETHPGLSFLISAKDFHSRYVATVVSRIFYSVNASWTGRITLTELRRSNFLLVLATLDQEEDINTVTQYFSYEHFYVVYCKFWELDEDHDLLISKADLARHNNFAISERMVDRIFSGAVTRGPSLKEDMMTYPDFVWFLLAEEDKRHPRSVEYWFRCMDLDGDGVLSMYELDYFYAEQLYKMEEMGIEPISFEDCLCQMLDMVKPRDRTCIRLSDLKQCKLCNIFFDTFFNLPKYLEHEQKDPFTNLRDIEEGLNELSDWDRYAAEAYEILVAEDNNQAGDEDYVYEDDFEPDEDEMQLRPMGAGGGKGGGGSAHLEGGNVRDERIHFLDSMGLDVVTSSPTGGTVGNNRLRKQTSS